MVVIDSDIFLIQYRYHRDARFGDNANFLRAISKASPAITLYSLMEILGQLSFNLSAQKLAEWETWLLRQYRLTVLWPDPGGLNAQEFIAHEIYQRPLKRMQANRVAFLDALVLQLAEDKPGVRAIVTWNAHHFKDKTWLPVLTPVEYLEAHP
jgi:hypothetical protein